MTLADLLPFLLFEPDETGFTGKNERPFDELSSRCQKIEAASSERVSNFSLIFISR